MMLYVPPELRKASRTAEIKRITQLADKLEPEVRKLFVKFIREIQAPAVLEKVRKLLQQGRTTAALNVMDQSVVNMSTGLTQVFNSAGKAEIAHIAAELGAVGVSLTFKAGDEAAAKIALNYKRKFIREFTQSQREATRQAVVRALRTGAGPEESARAFRDSIGLTKYQESVVNSYRKSLQRGTTDAIHRALRDRRSDALVQRVIDGDVILSKQQIERLVARYRAGWLAFRARTIARVEAGRAVALARRASMFQVLKQIKKDPDKDITRTWNATIDKRTRDTHFDLNGTQVKGMNSVYTTSKGNKLRFPKDPDAVAAEVINCRCVETFELH